MKKKDHITCRHSLLHYLNQYIETTMQSQFSYIGYSNRGAMYLIYDKQHCYLKSSPEIISQLLQEQCQIYCHHKQNKLVYLHYYDISQFIQNKCPSVLGWIKHSSDYAYQEKLSQQATPLTKKLRQLPNITPSIARLLTQANITTVTDFYALGAINSYMALQQHHGYQSISLPIFWALVGAELNCFDALIKPTAQKLFSNNLEMKRSLLNSSH